MGDPLARLVLLTVDEGRSAVVVADGALPVFERPLRSDEGALTPAWTDWPEFGLAGPLLDTVLDPERHHGGDEPYSCLVVLTSQPTGSPLPNGWTWQPLHRPDPTAPPGLRAAVAQRLDEIRGRLQAPSTRPRWCQEGWLARIEEWITDTLRSNGRATPTEIVQTKLWAISTVLRIEAPDGRSWCKASSDYFGHESEITRLASEQLGDRVPAVLGTEPEEHWLLLDDIAGTIGVAAPEDTARTATEITAIHAELVPAIDQFRRAGCPDRPIDQLPESIGIALRTELTRSLVEAPEPTCRAIEQAVAEALVWVASLGVPDTIVHGDLNWHNTARVDGRLVVFDWTDACRSHPLVDVAVWADWFGDDRDRVTAIWTAFCDAWVSRFGLAPFVPDVRLLELVGQAYLLDSYVGIVSAIEPIRQRECNGGIKQAFDRLVELSAATSGA